MTRDDSTEEDPPTDEASMAERLEALEDLSREEKSALARRALVSRDGRSAEARVRMTVLSWAEEKERITLDKGAVKRSEMTIADGGGAATA